MIEETNKRRLKETLVLIPDACPCFLHTVTVALPCLKRAESLSVICDMIIVKIRSTHRICDDTALWELTEKLKTTPIISRGSGWMELGVGELGVLIRVVSRSYMLKFVALIMDHAKQDAKFKKKDIQILNVYECNGTNFFFASLNGTFHLSSNENICSFAWMKKHSSFVFYNLYKDSNF